MFSNIVSLFQIVIYQKNWSLVIVFSTTLKDSGFIYNA